MAHFAKLDSNNTVVEVNVVNNAVLDPNSEEASGVEFLTSWSNGYTNWVQTSYNGTIRKQYAGKGYKYDVVVYQLTKKNDLLSYKDSTGYAVQTNNGETSHTGIELGLEKSLSDQFIINLATSYAKHKYVNWITSTTNYSGKTIEQAPSKLSNLRLNWLPTTETT